MPEGIVQNAMLSATIGNVEAMRTLVETTVRLGNLHDAASAGDAATLVDMVRSMRFGEAEAMLGEIHQRKIEAREFIYALDAVDDVLRTLTQRLASSSPIEDEDRVGLIAELLARREKAATEKSGADVPLAG